MIRFNFLGIVDDCLIIKAQIEPESYFNDCYIERVYIDTQDTYNKDESLHVYDKKYQDTSTKDINLYLNTTNLQGKDLSKNMFIVTVIANGTPSGLPIDVCGLDNTVIRGTVIDLQSIYKYMMNGIKEIGDTCSVPNTFINGILQFEALDLALKTGNYPLAINYWNTFFIKDNQVKITNKCGCHG